MASCQSQEGAGPPTPLTTASVPSAFTHALTPGHCLVPTGNLEIDIRSHHMLRGEVNSKEFTKVFYSFILLWRVLELLTACLNNIMSRTVVMFRSTTKWNSTCAKNTIHSIVSVIYSWTSSVQFCYLEFIYITH